MKKINEFPLTRLMSVLTIFIFIFPGISFFFDTSAIAENRAVPPLPLQNPAGAVLDNNEYFEWVEYSIRDGDDDGKNDRVKISFGVLTDGITERVRVNMTVSNNTGDIVKRDMMEFNARRRGANLTDTYFEYKVGTTGIYNFNLTLSDIAHDKVEDHSNRTNVSLYFNSRRYSLSLSAIVDDFNGNGTANDVLVICTDKESLPVLNASILIDGMLEGLTDERGKIYIYNLSGQHHEADAFYSIYHANTDFDISQPRPAMLLVDPEPMDFDGDSYHDDLRVYATLPDSSPAIGAIVQVGGSYVGLIGVEGWAQFENISQGDYSVRVSYQLPRTAIVSYSYFYAEGPLITEYDMNFYSIYARITNADGGSSNNDLEIYCDVDISDDVTAQVHINATVFNQWAEKTAFANTSYMATGWEYDDQYIYIYNLSEGYHTVRCELFDHNWTLRDVRTQTDVTVYGNDTPINVDKMVDDLDGGGSMNDVLFYAHLKYQDEVNATIKIFFSSNDTEFNSTLTDKWGMSWVDNLPEGEYYFEAYRAQGELADFGNFTIYNRILQTFQTMEHLRDQSGDGFHDDFVIYAYDDQGRPDILTQVTIYEKESGYIIRQGWTRGNLLGPGYFIAENLYTGDYVFTAVHVGPVFEKNISSGLIHSYHDWHYYYMPLFMDVEVFDGNNSGYRDDVLIKVNDSEGQPMNRTSVSISNNYMFEEKLTNENGTVIFYNLPGGNYRTYSENYRNDSPMRGESTFISNGPVAIRFGYFIDYIRCGDEDFRRNDISIAGRVYSSADGWENITVLMNMTYESNGTVHSFENRTFLGDGYNWMVYNLKDVGYEEYSISLILLDGNHSQIAIMNFTNIVVYEAKPILNTYAILMDAKWLYLRAAYAGETFFQSTFELYNSTGLVNRTRNVERQYFGDLYPDDYRWNITEESLNLTDHGELLIDGNYTFSSYLRDYDFDGYYDDFYLSIRYTNRTRVDNAEVRVYDANGLLLTTGNTSGGFELLNLSMGNYTYILTHNQKTLMSGRFYSYTNGYPNKPPSANISHPRNGSTYLVGNNIYFDAGNSTDMDMNDSIYYTWISDVDGLMSHRENFNTSILSIGVHNITLHCDDGHDNNVSTSIIVRVLPLNKLPLADAGPDKNSYINEAVDFLGSASDPDGVLVRFEWDFEGDAIYDWSSDKNGPVNHSYDSPGLYRARFRVTDDRGGLAVDSCNVSIIYSNRPPMADAGDNRSLFTGEKCVLDGTSSYDPDEIYGDQIVAFNWSCITHTIDLQEENSSEPYFYPGESGIYEFTLTVLDSNGQWSQELDRVWITVENRINSAPVAEAGSPRSSFIGDIFILDGSGSFDPDPEGYIEAYEWKCTNHSDIDLANASSARAEFTPGEEGIYTFSLRVKDNREDWSEFDFVNISVSEIIIPNSAPRAVVSPVQAARVFEPVTFSAAGSFDPDDDTNGNGKIDGSEKDKLQYQWDVDGDGKTDTTGRTTTYVYNSPGTFIVNLTVTDPEGLSDGEEFSIVVKPENHPPEASIDQGGKIVFNLDTQKILSAYSTYDPQEDKDENGKLSAEEIMGLNFFWDADMNRDSDGNGIKDDDTDWTGVEFSLDYSEYGTYVVGLKVLDHEGLSDVDSQEIVINSPPLDLEISFSASTNIYYKDQPLTFQGSCHDPDGTDRYLKFIWDMDSNGVPDIYGESVEFYYEEDGRKVVTLTVEDRYGASEKITASIEILPPIETMVETPEIISPRGGKITGTAITVEASVEDDRILWLEASITGEKWKKMRRQSGGNLWKYDFDMGSSRVINIYVRGVLKDFSGRTVYTDRVSVTVRLEDEGEGTDEKNEKIWEKYDIELGFVAAVLILFIVLLLVVRARRAPDYSRMIKDIYSEKAKRRKAGETKRERETSQEAEDEDGFTEVDAEVLEEEEDTEMAIEDGDEEYMERMIEELKAGDMILSHSGTKRTVISVNGPEMHVTRTMKDGTTKKERANKLMLQLRSDAISDIILAEEGVEKEELEDEEDDIEEIVESFEIDIVCPRCESLFPAVSEGKWPLVIDCPECGAKGRIIEKMMGDIVNGENLDNPCGLI
jgi:PKD repeat protein